MNMYEQLIDAAAKHPYRSDYDQLLAKGIEPERAARLLSTRAPQMIILRDGRTSFRVLNNPAALLAHAEIVAKCPGFNGKKPRRPAPSTRRGGVLYRHPSGFRLLIPDWAIAAHNTKLTIGKVTLRLLHSSQTLRGAIPDSWLVDLNAEAIEEELEPGWDLV